MEFGKITDKTSLDQIDFSLPAGHPGNLKVLGQEKAKQVNVYVGCPIWSDPYFPGKIYPGYAQPRDFVKYYGRQFNSIELNISHYKNLDPMTIEKWVDLTPHGFKFFPKVQNLISHTPLLKYNADIMRNFLANMKGFGSKLGMPFLQLPESYDSSKLHDLLGFLDDVSESNFAIELRHRSWYENKWILKYISNYFYKNNLTFLLLDTAGRRDVLHQHLTTKTAFIRFLANDLHPTDYKRIHDWIEQLAIWIENGLEEICFFVHTPTNALMPDIIIYFIKELAMRTSIKITLPKIRQNTLPPEKLF